MLMFPECCRADRKLCCSSSTGEDIFVMKVKIGTTIPTGGIGKEGQNMGVSQRKQEGRSEVFLGKKATSVAMNRPAPVELCHKNMRFLITHNPTDSTLSSFIEDLKRYGATTVVRVCDITYDKTPLEKDGITVVDWPFDDGAPPPSKLVDDWLSLLKRRFQEDPGCCVAVHCVAGLGRAPVLVALALIESGMKYEDAIQLIRQKRRGAINSKQLTYLEKYRSKQRLRFKDSQTHKNKCCTM
ncbi:protein tyrosine phosphatase type IVA 3 isoform X1 [Dunckerocampus dactyliophorus]|uniref:protein tyrosine phosphatase type IVA 3 isoform X1 n=2 Tax=Dunckerocampus dactyliophorus TaxID=161453 RepID=UPI0024053420|nr:protein tyrosine phosphatase type IVA 3 isoform X1 [Dunckerocampus dactyliophorus]